ncbi:IS110 family transposase [Edaphobacter modestus]|uniref:Transposase IS116/IS110/IS902 family protein n=1 Tax=Edaphobacter modestus TaxID=388466 RepID=A0A4Q7YGY0_9BACT|nr:IS110 family transposase [Edaphobacter modestus]RZU35761.1 transposase IS116/IS110/IS902 family protein [Edaphobacter modestus]
MDQLFQYFVGIDWGTQTHRVAVLDGNGRVVEQYDAAHSGDGLVALINKLKQRTECAPARVAIGIEVAWGALVETLVESGFTLFSINPKQVDRFRDRFTVAGAKDDARDALVLASSLRTDRQSYKRVNIDCPDLLRLRELSRFEDELKVELRRATNRLWQQLHRYYPQMLAISPAADDRLMWDLLTVAPTPAEGARISSLRVQRILKANRIRRLSADEVLSAFRTAPLALAPGSAEAACEHVLLLLPHVKLLDDQLREVGNRIARLLGTMTEMITGSDQPPCDAGLILSIPGIGPAVAAALLTEASRPIRERDYEALRCYAGTAPVTRQSGKRKTVGMRHACSPRLRNAVYHWATSSLSCDSKSRRQYDSLRASGHHHARALRGIADRLLGVLIALLKSQKAFDRARRDGNASAKNLPVVALACR